MPSTLTARGEDGKQSKKIERNTRKARICAILLCFRQRIVFVFAQGVIGAQLKLVGCQRCLQYGLGRLREQARSHIGCVSLKDPLWERACSRRGRLPQTTIKAGTHQ